MSPQKNRETQLRRIRAAEKALKDYLRVKHATFTRMGRSALVLALKALGAGEGSEIVLPSYTCGSIIAAVRYCGARAIFADVDPTTSNVDPTWIRKSLTPRTKAVLVIHCYGLPANMNEILDVTTSNNVPLIEDAAHALGAEYRGRKVGTFGDISFFSFSKNLGASSGGALATSSNELAEKVQQALLKQDLTNPGKLPLKYKLLSIGRQRKSIILPLLSSLRILRSVTKVVASRTEDIPPSYGVDPKVAFEVTKKLKQINTINSRRIAEAKHLEQILTASNLAIGKDIVLPAQPSDRTHVYYLYPLKVLNWQSFQCEVKKLNKYVYFRGPWKCTYGAQAEKLTTQLILLDMKHFSVWKNAGVA